MLKLLLNFIEIFFSLNKLKPPKMRETPKLISKKEYFPKA